MKDYPRAMILCCRPLYQHVHFVCRGFAQLWQISDSKALEGTNKEPCPVQSVLRLEATLSTGGLQQLKLYNSTNTKFLDGG
jgi:hypothetical protein